MKALLFSLCALCLLQGFDANAAGEKVYGFEAMAPITGTIKADTPHRVRLSNEIIAASRDSMADLRLVDDTDALVPFVIYDDVIPATTPTVFTFEVKAFEAQEGVESFTLTCPKNAVPFRRLLFDTPARDFKKNVAISRWDDEDQKWLMVTTDTIFDFSSRVDLRRTWIDIPRMEPGTLRVDVQSDTDTPDDPGLSVTYKGLKLTDGSGVGGSFRIDAIRGSTARFDESRVKLDNKVFKKPAATQQADGSTVVDLGRVNMPVYEIMLLVDTPYFHRTVKVEMAQDKTPETWTTVATGEIFAMPGMTRKETLIAVQKPQFPYLRLRIENGDSPALKIRSLTVRRVRENLYFIPAVGRSYRLLAGNPDVRHPSYDMARIISPKPAELAALPSLALGATTPNPAYNAAQIEDDRMGTQGWFEHWAFTVIIILLAAIMGIWIGVLLRRNTCRENL